MFGCFYQDKSDVKNKENSSPEFQKQVQKDLLALDQAAHTSSTEVPSEEQLQPEEVPVRKPQKPTEQLYRIQTSSGRCIFSFCKCRRK